MNVIFLDFDGVLDTHHYNSQKDIERRIKILADICSEYNCKVVILSTHKDVFIEDTLDVLEDSWISEILEMFKKYNIECIGRTPNIEKIISEHLSFPIWKEDEIIHYLKMHPEIEHYCVIDDDDLKYISRLKISDLDKVRDHLVETTYYSQNPEEEGLLPKHKEEVEKILKKDIKNIFFNLHDISLESTSTYNSFKNACDSYSQYVRKKYPMSKLHSVR